MPHRNIAAMIGPTFLALLSASCGVLEPGDIPGTDTASAQTSANSEGEDEESDEFGLKGKSGRAIVTFEDKRPQGQCMFPDAYALPGVLEVAVKMSGSKDCGRFVKIEGPTGQVLARIMDHCPTCEGPNHFDFKGPGDFQKVAPLQGRGGRASVTWTEVARDTGAVKVRIKDGASAHWSEILVFNVPTGVKRVKMKRGGEWVALKRQHYNYWQVPSGPGSGKKKIQITLRNGRVIEKEIDPTRSGAVF